MVQILAAHSDQDQEAHVDAGADHVLVVDDDPQLRALVTKFLRSNGVKVTGARDGREMIEAIKMAHIDLIILDLMLPGVSGLELCRELRANSTIPIVILTANGDDTDRIVGLEMGADDYITKPFNPRELLARIKAVLRRTRAKSDVSGQDVTGRGTTGRGMSRGYSFMGWTLDTLRRELFDSSNVLVDLSAGEYDLLVALVEAPQRVLSRDRLLDLAKNRVAGSFDRSIDVQISRLRKKIETDDNTPLIKTVRGTGYMFLATVSRL